MSFNAPLNNDQYSSVVKYYPKKWFNAKKSFYRKQNQTTISYKSRFSGYLSPEQSSNSFSIRSASNFTQTILEPIDEPKKWSEDFVFGVITEVVVQHFSENPTSTCWVILQSDVERRDAIVNNISSHHSFDEIHFDEIKLSKLYSVKFEGGWYRGMVLHIINSTYVWVRLIDNGRCFRAHINALRKLYNVATDLKGLAFEINFEPSRNIRIGEVLRVENISHNADEIIGVRFVEDEKIFTDQNIESTPLPVDVATELFCLDCTNIDKGYISACEYDRKKVQTVDEISDKISKYVKGNDGDKKYCPKLKELCLAYVDDDGLWYRTKCVENVLLNVFRLEKIDYGSTVDVTSENIRKMVEDFLQPSVIMHQCAILGRSSYVYLSVNDFLQNFSLFFERCST